jgi:V8-like Glu-specific endopeptidase
MQTFDTLADLALEDAADEESDVRLDRLDDELDALQDENWDHIVFGTDNRFPVPAQTHKPSSLQFPYNTICFLERVTTRGTSRCTGTLIAPQVVLTAAHCLANTRTVRVTPGADLQSSNPRLQRSFGSIQASSARFRSNTTLDFGVIILPRPFRSPTQFMRLQARSDARSATLVTLAGYPGDKPRGRQWAHSKVIPSSGVTRDRLFYQIDTFRGQSGSPVWLLGNNGIRLILGVHSGGPTARLCSRPGAPAGRHNCAVRITCPVIDTILGWCREFRVQAPTVDSYSQLCR